MEVIGKYYKVVWDRYDWDIVKVVYKNGNFYACEVLDSGFDKDNIGKTFDQLLDDSDLADNTFTIELKGYNSPLWRVLNGS